MCNCGRLFKLEMASPEFEQDYRKLLGPPHHPKVHEKLKQTLKKWAEDEFNGDPQFSIIPSLYLSLRSQGMDFSSQGPQVNYRSKYYAIITFSIQVPEFVFIGQ